MAAEAASRAVNAGPSVGYRRHGVAPSRETRAAAAGRDEGPFLDQIEHVAGAAGRAIPVLLVERPGVAIDEPTPKYVFRRQR
jgi:hypothetical protein